MFRTRLISGIVLIVIAFAAFYAGAPVLTLLLFLISLAGFRELSKALGVSNAGQGKKIGGPEAVGYFGIGVYYLLILMTDMNWLKGDILFYMFCIVGFFLAELSAYVLTFPKYRAEQIAFAVFSFLYVPVMLSFVDFIRMGEKGWHKVWFILICSWGSDTCAYCVGKLIGKKKIFPVLSPKKSLEGCIGGILGAALLGAAYSFFVIGKDAGVTGFAALICGAGAVVSMVGDLAASAIKRNRGIKDYGKLIPGHGGIMDRFDSVIVTAPLVYFLSLLMM